MTNLEKKLNYLLTEGVIKDYNICNVSDNGIAGEESKVRNTERLNIVFNSGDSITIGTFCSGCLEDTWLTLEE